MKLPRLFRGPTRRVRRGRAARNTPVGIVIPKKLMRRWVWYLNPKRLRDFWFTRAGGRTALKISAYWFGTGLALIIALFIYFAKDLPTPGQINSKLLAQTTRFYDRTGETLLYEVHGDQNRTVIKLEDMSDHIQHATVAIEDKNFYRHGAFSSLAIIRAAINNVWNRVTNNEGNIQGGSTITQQYVKNALLSPERTFTRKVKEVILSIQIEQLYAKDDILELYLNEIPYGAQAYGAQAAAKTYFSKDAKDLDPDEAALLAALPRAPTYYSPYGQHLDELIGRRDLILDLMLEQGYLSKEDHEKAKAADTYAKVNDVPDLYANVTAPHFVLYAEEFLKEQLGEREVNEGGLNVITTLDVKLQKQAEKAVKQGIGVIDAAGGNNAALVAGDPKSGHVLAMVGSRNFNQAGYGSFNAALARRQPGSSFKPYVYATGFKSGNWGPGSVMYDVSTDFGGGYRPENYDHRFHGANTIRWFLGNSFNIPAVKMLYIAGVQEALDTAHSMGITTLENPEDYGLSLVLGAGEVRLADHVNGFQSFANGGEHYEASPIMKVTNPKGETVIDNEKPQAKRVLDPQVAYLVNHMLSDPGARAVTFGGATQYMSIPGQTNFVKTGTTDNNRDGWMLGGTKHIVAGVWVGHSDNKAMSGITSTLTGSIWGPFMSKAHEGKPNAPWSRPDGIKSVTLDNFTGKLPGEGSRGTHTDLFPSWYTPPKAAATQKVVINKINGKLATDCTPEGARKTVTVGGITAEIPPTDPAYGRWNPPVQALAKSLGFGAAPTEKDNCENAEGPLITSLQVINENNDPFPPQNDAMHIYATVKKKSYPLKKIVFMVDGEVVNTKSISSSGTYDFTVKNKSPGDYKISVTVTDQAGLFDTEERDWTLAMSSGSRLFAITRWLWWPSWLSGWATIRGSW